MQQTCDPSSFGAGCVACAPTCQGSVACCNAGHCVTPPTYGPAQCYACASGYYLNSNTFTCYPDGPTPAPTPDPAACDPSSLGIAGCVACAANVCQGCCQDHCPPGVPPPTYVKQCMACAPGYTYVYSGPGQATCALPTPAPSGPPGACTNKCFLFILFYYTTLQIFEE
jgi:hypothetical protein